MTDYNLSDRVLHRLALQGTSLAELSFDIDQRMTSADPAAIVDGRHVFVSGLARAGTTVLMRRFHATGEYRSLTYRDMPFVLAPNMWRRLARSSRRHVAPAQRAHGDRILVDADSPESLDEVFWKVFAGEEYIGKEHLRPHTPDQETISRFVRYVNAVLNAQNGQAERYLSKNNNNILRLNAIRQAFPKALILIPFRKPLSHAASLLRQHRNFLKMQAEKPFVLSYMTWLAHHEFGHDHRPFRFSGDTPSSVVPQERENTEYWMNLWCATYEWLERSAPEDAVFVCYEDLCRDPNVWKGLARAAGIPDSGEGYEIFQLRDSDMGAVIGPDLAQRAANIHARLVERARAALIKDGMKSKSSVCPPATPAQ